jgi:hypothetical protein
MTVSVVVPFHPSDEWRQRAWDYVAPWWGKHFPDWELIRCTAEPYTKGGALHNGVAIAEGSTLILADADSFILDPDELAELVGRVDRKKAPVPWVMPHRYVHRVSRSATEAIYETGMVDIHSVQYPVYGGCIGGGMTILNRKAWKTVRGIDPRFCVDEETMILTSTGWRDYHTLQVGDLALTLNHETGMSEWQPVQAVNVFPAQDGEMLSMESKNHSSLTTLNHRWPVVRRPNYRPGIDKGIPYSRRDWKTSGTLTSEDKIQIAAECADLPIEPKYSDAMVETVAWFWTEGSITRGGLGRSVSLAQSLRVNSSNCVRIRAALTKLFGNPVAAFVRGGRAQGSHAPQWREHMYPSQPGLLHFYLNAEAGDLLQSLAPGRVPANAFLLSLTRAQLGLFIEVSMLADRDSPYCLSQKNPAAAEAFQFACILAGHATSIRIRANSSQDPKRDYQMTGVTIRKSHQLGPHKGTHKMVPYSGEVWCPTTANGTWLARRHGTTWFTGNSGWGGEDRCFGWALGSLVPGGQRGDARLLHLWHPIQGPRQAMSRATLALINEYRHAKSNPGRMAAYIAARTA